LPSAGVKKFILEYVCVLDRLTGFLTGLEIRCKARSQSTLSPPHTRTQAKISKTETLFVLPLYCEMEAGINMHTCVLICFSALRSHCCTQTLSGLCVCVLCLLHFCTALLLFGLRAVTPDEHTHTLSLTFVCLCMCHWSFIFFCLLFFFFSFLSLLSILPHLPAFVFLFISLHSMPVPPSLSLSPHLWRIYFSVSS